MNPQEPVIPDPNVPAEDPSAPVGDPTNPDQPSEYSAGYGGDNEDGRLSEWAAERRERLDDYDEAVDASFPASDPPAASEPGR